jgi:uncharacterized surface protein with fasciclin (FAS1) repeats
METMKRYLYTAACAAACALLCFACRDDRWEEHTRATEKGVNLTLPAVIQENPDWSAFYQALTVTGYDSVLNGASGFTVFVPSNAAWAGVEMDDTAALASIVAYHIACERRLASDSALRNMQMINGKRLRYRNQRLSGAQITAPDCVASNGVVHGIDTIFTAAKNIWEYMWDLRNASSQVGYIYGWNRREMDMERSIRNGVNAQGQPTYDTAWVDVNDFLEAVPLNDEAQEFTYIVLEDNGFFNLYDKYAPYFNRPTADATERLTSFQVCRDLAFGGRIEDLAQRDSIANIFGVKVRLKGAAVRRSFEASNGMVYVLSSANVLLRDKVKPVIIEGENFSAAADPQYVFTRYKPLWASGAKDVMLASSVVQTNRVVVGTDQYGRPQYGNVSKTFLWSDKYRANMSNFWIEYKAEVFSVGYKIYYVAFDDIEEHYADPLQRLRLEQKLFISLPDAKTLAKGDNKVNADAVSNNYLGDETCFVGVDTATGALKETQLRKWSLTLDAKSPQFISKASTAADADVMKVSNAGELTLWLCNTARATTASAQGMLFLDYIKLEPTLPDEKED